MHSITFLLSILFAGTSFAAQLYRFHSGDCPKIESMDNFNVDRFLGTWYVLENANDNGNVCLREEFNASQEAVLQKNDDDLLEMAKLNEVDETKAKDDSSGHKMAKVYHVKRIYLPFGGRQFITETGKVKFLSNHSQSEMEINFPYVETGMLNLKHYQVIATDYDKYALVWRCQKTIFGHRRAAQLMSRYSALDPKSMQEMKTLLKHFEAEHEIKFSPVRQTDCTEMPLELHSTGSTTRKPPTVGDLSSNEEDKIYQPSSIKNKKKLINIDIGGFHLSISYPFW